MTAPLPAAINLLVPIGTLLGWSAAPATPTASASSTQTETRDIVQAASQHPRTRWCATIINPDGTAAAHACAPGQHPWTPPAPNPIRTAATRSTAGTTDARDGPDTSGHAPGAGRSPRHRPGPASTSSSAS